MSRINNKATQLLSAMILAGLACHSLAADSIKIGIAGPKTGPVAQYGDMQFSGARMAIEQINAKGGVDGKQLVAVEYDDACDPKQAVAVANKVVNDGVKFVVGHLCSSSTQPASDIYEDEGIIMITPAATSPELTARGYKMIFRTIGLDNAQGPAAARYIASLKPANVAVLHDKQQYGEGIASSVKEILGKEGVKVAMFEGINVGERDYSSILAKLKQANVDFVYFGGYHPEMGLLLRQAREKGLTARFMGPEGVGNDSISQIAKDASEGMLVTLPKAFDQDPANKALVEAFEAKKESSSGAFVLPTYSAVQVLADAIASTHSEDSEKVAEAIHAGTFKTPTGDLSFDEKGDLKDFKFVVYEWHYGKPKTAAQDSAGL
ncbi:branched-chain amino acid ABC transporter substrate-binding protein [Pseudomonas sp. MAFF 302030]|uniref:Branched-chain amino acid ABC transporter substrate-binding protein n=1 Tax=Pseudomonas morbosilactucae TaxID=2938197 RepID=A0A9X1YYX6_9PSED|nr:branched-chain amino acid ABC transporter substrate-binding protein [Pseudomonas morbosilactucae]MCK9800853.1 branched-chain amino acid ABC transporter substrate-binding protein [Pseudomonas morbosilactucae]